jgi:hypothetical protein
VPLSFSYNIERELRITYPLKWQWFQKPT